MNDVDATRVVFVHGAGGGGWEWSIWQRVFAASGAQVVAPDLRPAAAGLAATRLTDYADQLADWCAAAGAPQLLVGASLGGLLALMIASRVEPTAVIMVNPLPPVGVAPPAQLREPRDIVPWGRERSLRATLRALPDADDAARLFAFRRWRDESGAVLRDAQDVIEVAPPKCPQLVLASELDSACPASGSRALAAHLRADFRLLPGASHVGPLLGRDAAQVAADAWQWYESHAAHSRRGNAVC